jgi:FGGY-family pentulose kinase
MARDPLFIGVDVGTGSARAAVFTSHGRMLGSATHAIQMWKPQTDFVEQSSDDIWKACSLCVREAMSKAGARKDDVGGIGFDATCSLVVLDAEDRPLSVSPTKNPEQNVIVWMDHRAVEQAERINRTHHSVLRYVGGIISPEMETPKLLWLKENYPDTWKSAVHFFDLPDYLTYRATGDATRSLCSTVCKWTYMGQKGEKGEGWDVSYFRKIGLGDLAAENFRRIGTSIRPMGEPIGQGLSKQAAVDFDLRPGTPVGVSIIDAHAGGLGMLGARLGDRKVTPPVLESRLALIGGTSSCHMAVSRKPRFIPGIWGPYFSAMIPGFWLTEGGQSATGALIDHLLFTHPAYPALETAAKEQGKSVYELLNLRLDALAKAEKAPFPAALTRHFHVQPDFHGNRSPRANPTLKGTLTGLSLSAGLDDLALQYLASIQAVAYGTRHILEEMKRKGYAIKTIFLCGGGTKNPVFIREHADITGCQLVLPREPEAVLLGAATLGALASGHYPSVLDAMQNMNVAGTVITPTRGPVAAYHRRKYQVFHRLHADFLAYRKIMGKS